MLDRRGQYDVGELQCRSTVPGHHDDLARAERGRGARDVEHVAEEVTEYQHGFLFT